MRKLIIFVVLCLMAIPAMATDNIKYAIDLRTDLRTLFKDEGGQTLTDDVCDRLLNMRMEWFATLGGIGKVDTIETVNNKLDYLLNYDFIGTDKVAIKRAGETKHRALDRRAFVRTDPSLFTVGQDPTPTNPTTYTIVQVADSTWYLKLGAPESETTTDSIFVYYKAQATRIPVDSLVDGTPADSVVINIPYAGRFLITYATFLDALIMNRDAPTINKGVLEIVKNNFDFYLQLYMRDYSVPEFRQNSQ